MAKQLQPVAVIHCIRIRLKVFLAYILQIVITHNQIYLSVQPVKDFSPFGRTAKTEIAQMKDGVILTDCIIPILLNSFAARLAEISAFCRRYTFAFQTDLSNLILIFVQKNLQRFCTEYER